MELPPAPPERRGSFWNMGNGPTTIWDVGAKILIWTAVGIGAIYALWVIGAFS